MEKGEGVKSIAEGGTDFVPPARDGEAVQGGALDEVGRIEMSRPLRSRLGAEIVDSGQPRVVQPRQQGELLPHPLQSRFPRQVEQLQRQLALEQKIPDEEGGRHATSSERPHDPIAALDQPADGLCQDVPVYHAFIVVHPGTQWNTDLVRRYDVLH